MFCDCHIHMLPSIDDGPSTPEEAAAMLKILISSGVTHAILTPHFDMQRDTVATFIASRKRSLNALRKCADIELTKNFTFVLSAEVPITRGISSLKELSKLCVGESRYLPMALPIYNFERQAISELTTLIHRKGIKPLICHTERYCIFYNAEDRKKLMSLPHAVYHFGTKSLYDKDIFKTVTDMMRDDKVILLGTNGHNMATRKPDCKIAANIIGDRIGSSVYNVLALKNKFFVKSCLGEVR